MSVFGFFQRGLRLLFVLSGLSAGFSATAESRAYLFVIHTKSRRPVDFGHVLTALVSSQGDPDADLALDIGGKPKGGRVSGPGQGAAG